MKKRLTILLAGCALLIVSCEKDYDGTEFTYEETFVVENDELVPAHKYVLNFPAQGGSVDMKIVSSGMHYREPLIIDNQFVVELLNDINNDPESNIYDYVEVKMINGKIKQKPRYLQTLRITAGQNKRSKSRSAKLDIQTSAIWGVEASRAVITLRQAGAK